MQQFSPPGPLYSLDVRQCFRGELQYVGSRAHKDEQQLGELVPCQLSSGRQNPLPQDQQYEQDLV